MTSVSYLPEIAAGFLRLEMKTQSFKNLFPSPPPTFLPTPHLISMGGFLSKISKNLQRISKHLQRIAKNLQEFLRILEECQRIFKESPRIFRKSFKNLDGIGSKYSRTFENLVRKLKEFGKNLEKILKES